VKFFFEGDLAYSPGPPIQQLFCDFPFQVSKNRDSHSSTAIFNRGGRAGADFCQSVGSQCGEKFLDLFREPGPRSVGARLRTMLQAGGGWRADFFSFRPHHLPCGT